MASQRRTAGGRAVKAALIAASLASSVSAAADPVDRWAGDIAEASSRFGIPGEWIRRVMRAESGGQPFVGGQPIISRAGAMGLMQLMPGTWRNMRMLLGLDPDPHDPHDNILAGSAYLRAMYDRFGYPGMFAAYNAGPARYAAYLTTGRALPAETRAYVARVMPSARAAVLAGARGGRLFVAPSGGDAPPADAARERTLFVALSGAGAR